MHVHEVGFGQRLDELAKRGEDLVPGIVGKRNRWKALVYGTRNRYAHQTSVAWLEDDDIDALLTVAHSLRWLLRALLLTEAGVAAELLGERFATHQPYRQFLSNAESWQPKVFARETG